MTYKKHKPLSSRLTVEDGTTVPKNVKAKKLGADKLEGPPAFMKPVRTSGKAQGIEEGTAGDVKDYLFSQGETVTLTPQELHLAQMYAAGNDDALDAL